MASSSRLLSWSQNNVLWLIQQPRRRLENLRRGHWIVTKPCTGAFRRTTYVYEGCAESLIARGLVEPSGLTLKRRLFRISEKGREAYRTGRFNS